MFGFFKQKQCDPQTLAAQLAVILGPKLVAVLGPLQTQLASFMGMQSTIERGVERLMTAQQNLDAQVTQLTGLVTTLTTNVSNAVQLLAKEHAELVTALGQAGGNDPAVQAAADKIAVAIQNLTNTSNAAAAAIPANPDPADAGGDGTTVTSTGTADGSAAAGSGDSGTVTGSGDASTGAASAG